MEDVHHHVAVIEDDPLAHRKSIDGVRPRIVFLFQSILNLAGDGFEVRFRSSRANQKKIREPGNLTQIQRDDVFGFLVRGQLRAKPGEVYGLDGAVSR